jgi:hypothetical protein
MFGNIDYFFRHVKIISHLVRCERLNGISK